MTTLTSVPPPAAPAGSGATFRRWRSLDDLSGMGEANAELRRHAGVLEPIDPAAMRHRYTHLVNSDPATDCVLVERDGATRGYVRMEWHDLVDGGRIYDCTLLLAPSAWGLGLGEAMVRWGEARAAEMAAEHPTDRPSWLGQYAFGGDAELRDALARLGYEAVRTSAEMLRADLEALQDPVLPDGYELRAPEPDELPAVHAMYVAAFSEHWGEYDPADQRIEEWVDDPRFRRDLVVVAFRGQEPASAVSNIVEALPDLSRRGLLESVATHPGHRRLGLARAAVWRSLELLRAEGTSSAYLGVDAQNHNHAMALYESCGFRVASTGSSYRKPLAGREGP